MKRFLAEIWRRRLLQVLVVYVAAAFIALQFTLSVLPAYGVPDGALKLILAVSVLGVLPVLLLAWFYRWQAPGLTREQPSGADPRPRSLRGWRLNAATAGVVGLAGVISMLLHSPAETAMARLNVAPFDTSLAVMPFADLSQARDRRYFAEGVATEVADDLARVPGLKVPARESTSVAAGRGDLQQAAQQLGVTHVLAGNVQIDGQRLRVQASLLSTDTGASIWKQDFERRVGDVFQVQQDIAASVAQALRKEVRSARAPAATRGAGNLPALEEYWRGLADLATKTRASTDSALAHFQAAVKLDPNFAEGHAGIARAQLNRMAWYSALERQKAVSVAGDEVTRALQLDDSLVEAHEAYGELRLIGGPPAFGQGFYLQAQRAFAKALSINPNRASVYALIGRSARITGRFDEGVAAWKKAIELEPLAPGYRVDFGRTLDAANRYDEALREFKEAMRIDPGYADTYYAAAQLFGAATGQLDEAARHARRAVELDPASPKYSGMLIACLSDLELWDEGLQEIARSRPWADRDTFWLARAAEFQMLRGDGDLARHFAAQHDVVNQAAGISSDLSLRVRTSGLQPGELVRLYQQARVDFPALFADKPELASPYARVTLPTLIWLAALQGDVAERDRLINLVRPYLPPPDAPLSSQAGMQPVDIMQILVVAGERERAMKLLRASVSPPNALLGPGWWYMSNRNMAPLCAMLCGSPEYDALLAKIKLEVARQRAQYQAHSSL